MLNLCIPILSKFDTVQCIYISIVIALLIVSRIVTEALPVGLLFCLCLALFRKIKLKYHNRSQIRSHSLPTNTCRLLCPSLCISANLPQIRTEINSHYSLPATTRQSNVWNVREITRKLPFPKLLNIHMKEFIRHASWRKLYRMKKTSCPESDGSERKNLISVKLFPRYRLSGIYIIGTF